MKKAHRQGQWRFPKSKDFLKEYPRFAAMINKLWKLTWYAYIGASLADPRFSPASGGIGRYTKRAVMAEYRTPPGRDDLSLFRLGLKFLHHLLNFDLDIPVEFHIPLHEENLKSVR
jgi:hypothetical protein